VIRVALLALLLTACASAPLTPAPPAAPPPDASSDEAGLRQQADRLEAELRESPLRVRDPTVETYLAELTCRVAGEYCSEIRVYLLRQPYFNAFMAPNGMLVLWTGLLLRIEDEAQLVAVIGHEIGHYVARHSLERWRRLKSTGNAALALNVLGSGLGSATVGAVASLAAYSTIYAFSRDQERAADDYGIRRMRELGYRDRRAAELWSAVYEEDRWREKSLLSGIFATHPATAERRDRLLAATRADIGEARAAPFRNAVAALREDWLEDEVARRHWRQSEVLLARLAGLRYQPALVQRYQGELYRRRGAPGDAERAEIAYRAALASAPEDARSWRGLGLVLRQQGRNAEAREAFRRYLEAAPQAEDRAMIESWL
jgi:predicted Zn-dependent protease